MIIGIGIDIIELARIKEMIERQSKLINRVLTPNEIVEFEQLSDNRKVEFLAGRFAAKEAYSKAVGTGIGSELSFQDMEIQKDKKGKPFFAKPAGKGTHLSISHSQAYAVANVVIEKA